MSIHNHNLNTGNLVFDTHRYETYVGLYSSHCVSQLIRYGKMSLIHFKFFRHFYFCQWLTNVKSTLTIIWFNLIVNDCSLLTSELTTKEREGGGGTRITSYQQVRLYASSAIYTDPSYKAVVLYQTCSESVCTVVFLHSSITQLGEFFPLYFIFMSPPQITCIVSMNSRFVLFFGAFCLQWYKSDSTCTNAYSFSHLNEEEFYL